MTLTTMWSFLIFGTNGGSQKSLCFKIDAKQISNRRNRTEYVPGVSERRRRPWLWRSSSWHARCRWRHLGWRFPRRPSRHLWFPRRWDQKFSSHHLFGQDDGWLAWWYPGCYHARTFLMTLGASFSQTFSSFTTSRHDEFVLDLWQEMILAHCAACLYTACFADLLGKMDLS